MNDDKSILIPSDLYNVIYRDLLTSIVDKLEMGQNVKEDECLDDCIHLTCHWLPEHILGCRELDCDTTMDEIIDSIRQGCPNAEFERTGLNSYKIKLQESYWTLYRIVPVGWSDETKIRITYKHHSWRGFVPTNKLPEIIKYTDSLVPEFRKLIQKALLEGNRQIIISLIEKTAIKAKGKKRT